MKNDRFAAAKAFFRKPGVRVLVAVVLLGLAVASAGAMGGVLGDLRRELMEQTPEQSQQDQQGQQKSGVCPVGLGAGEGKGDHIGLEKWDMLGIGADDGLQNHPAAPHHLFPTGVEQQSIGQ